MDTAVEDEFAGHNVTVTPKGDGMFALTCECGWPKSPILDTPEKFVKALIQRHHIMVENGNG